MQLSRSLSPASSVESGRGVEKRIHDLEELLRLKVQTSLTSTLHTLSLSLSVSNFDVMSLKQVKMRLSSVCGLHVPV